MSDEILWQGTAMLPTGEYFPPKLAWVRLTSDLQAQYKFEEGGVWQERGSEDKRAAIFEAFATACRQSASLSASLSRDEELRLAKARVAELERSSDPGRPAQLDQVHVTADAKAQFKLDDVYGGFWHTCEESRAKSCMR